jgi:hypothetical protein
MIHFRHLITNEAVPTVKVVQISEKTVKEEEEEKVGIIATISNITTTERMKPPHMCSRDIIVNNLKDMFLLSTSSLWSEANKHGLCINSTNHQLLVLEELWDPRSNYHLNEMVVFKTYCELKGKEKEVLRTMMMVSLVLIRGKPLT